MKILSLCVLASVLVSSAVAQVRHGGHHHATALPPFVVVEHRLTVPPLEPAVPKVAPMIDVVVPILPRLDLALPAVVVPAGG